MTTRTARTKMLKIHEISDEFSLSLEKNIKKKLTQAVTKAFIQSIIGT